MDELAGRSIDELPLSFGSYRVIKRLGFQNIGQLIEAWSGGELRTLAVRRRAELGNVLEPYLELSRRANPTRDFFGRSLLGQPAGGRRRVSARRIRLDVKRRGPNSSEPVKALSAIPDESVVGRELSQEETESCKAVLGAELGLSVRATKVIEKLKLETVLDVAQARSRSVFAVKNCGKRTLHELRQAVLKALTDGSGEVPALVGDPASVRAAIESMLSTLPDREAFVLRERFGLWTGSRETLEDIGYVLGVTRERVRQLEGKGIRRLNHSPARRRGVALLLQMRRMIIGQDEVSKRFGVFSEADLRELFYPEVNGTSDGGTATDLTALAFKFLVEVFAIDFSLVGEGFVRDSKGRYYATERAAKRLESLEAAVRSLLIAKGRPIAAAEIAATAQQDATRQEIERLGEVSDIVGLDWTGSIGLRQWPFFERRSLSHLIQRTLMELREPTHFTYIAERTNAMFPGKAALTSHHAAGVMLRYPEIFVSLGRGMYALRNWGINRPPFIKDFLAQAISERGGKARPEELADIAAQKFGFKRTSVMMTLSMNPQIFRTTRDGLVGLV